MIACVHLNPVTADIAKDSVLVRQRTDLTTLAIGRYRARVCDIAALVRKHPNSVAKWLNKGLRLERSDPEFRARLDHIDAAWVPHFALTHHGCHVHTSTLVEFSPALGTTGNCVNVYVAHTHTGIHEDHQPC